MLGGWLEGIFGSRVVEAAVEYSVALAAEVMVAAVVVGLWRRLWWIIL